MMILNDDKFEHNNTMILAELDQDDPKFAQSFMHIRNNLTMLNNSQNNLNTTLNFVKRNNIQTQSNANSLRRLMKITTTMILRIVMMRWIVLSSPFCFLTKSSRSVPTEQK